MSGNIGTTIARFVEYLYVIYIRSMDRIVNRTRSFIIGCL